MRESYTIIYIIGADDFPISQSGAVERLLFGENLKKINNGGNHMSKKLVSVMLALVMVLTALSMTAFAANAQYEDPDAEEAYTQMWYLETANEPDANGNYTVDVYLEANYAVGAISFHVDAVGATLKGAEISSFIADDEGYNANVQVNKSKGNVFIIPEPTNAAATGLDFSVAELVATLTYTLDADTATITLVNDAKTIDNDGKLVAARLGDGVLASNTMYYGQWVVDMEYTDIALGDPISEVTLGEEVVAANPVLIGVDTGVVDNATGYVYGVPAGADANDYFEVENGSFSIAETVTGAVLIVKNAAGEPFAAYTLVIFGDVNGDGAITAGDYTVVKEASLGATIEDEAANFAGDVNGDGTITAGDYTVVKEASLGGDITSNPYAA